MISTKSRPGQSTQGQQFAASPAIGHDETVYVESGATLHAYSPDGISEVVLQAVTSGDSASTCSTPAVAYDDTIYFEDENRNLAAINPDGSLKWSYDLGPNFEIRAPAIARDGTVYITSEHTGTLFAIDPDSGQFDWSRDLGGNRLTTPVVACDGSIYVGSEDALHALDSTGQVTWSSAAGQIRTPPVIGSDGTIYVGTATGDLELFSPDGEALGGYGISETREAIRTPPVIKGIQGNDTIYLGSGDNYYIFKMQPSGNIDYQYRSGRLLASPVVTGLGWVYFSAERDGQTRLFKTESSNGPFGALAGGWAAALAWDSSPAMGRHLYVGGTDGYLFALNLGPSM